MPTTFVHVNITGSIFRKIFGDLPEDPSLISPGSVAAAVYVLRFAGGDATCTLGYFNWVTFFPIKALPISIGACKTSLNGQNLPYVLESCEETTEYDSCGCAVVSTFFHEPTLLEGAKLCKHCSPEGYRSREALKVVITPCREHGAVQAA